MTTNYVTEAHKVDFLSAIGRHRKDDGRSGIFVYPRWAGTPRMGDAITVTLWQSGATSYGEPESMPEAGFNPDDPTGAFKQGPLGPHPIKLQGSSVQPGSSPTIPKSDMTRIHPGIHQINSFQRQIQTWPPLNGN